MILKNNQGALYGTGFIQTSPNFSGEVKGKFESGVTIKKRNVIIFTDSSVNNKAES